MFCNFSHFQSKQRTYPQSEQRTFPNLKANKELFSELESCDSKGNKKIFFDLSIYTLESIVHGKMSFPKASRRVKNVRNLCSSFFPLQLNLNDQRFDCT